MEFKGLSKHGRANVYGKFLKALRMSPAAVYNVYGARANRAAVVRPRDYTGRAGGTGGNRRKIIKKSHSANKCRSTVH